ncbi:MAG: alpha/beta hydrolase [Candidatus Nanosalina sp.]
MTLAQVVFIDGGMTFRNREDYLEFLRNREISLEEEENWSNPNYLEDSLEAEIARVEMPCRDNAKYEEWRITFERYLPKLSEDLILVGYSLGGTFLAKYLSENRVEENILSTYLIAPPFDDDMPEEDLAGGFELGENLSMLEKNTGKLELVFSENDDVVPIRHAEKFNQELLEAVIEKFKDRNGHFQVEKFPELVEKINHDLKNQR